MHAIAEGYREIHIYGIHLATKWEYQQQRPNFEFLLGVAMGLGIKVILPAPAPICKASYQYAYAPKADLPLMQVQQRIDQIKAEGLAIRQAYADLPWHAVTRRKDLAARLRHLDATLADTRQQLEREQLRSLVA